MPDGGNPGYIQAPTGVPGEMIFTDDEIAVYSLASFPVDSETVFGIADMVSPALYRIEHLDASSSPLSLAGIKVNNYNLFYRQMTGPPLVADYNVALDFMTGLLSVDPTHDANTGSTYIHSGLVTFSNLPTETATIRILSGQDQLSEGVQFYFGGSASSVIPIPAAIWLFGSGLAGLIGVSRRKRA